MIFSGTIQRLLYLVLLLSSFSQQGFAQSKSSFVWNILPHSSIMIYGCSNVNTFGCSSTGAFKSRPIEGVAGKGNVNLKGSIAIAINQLDCKNKMLNRDLRKTLKAEEYPTLTINFINLERMPLLNTNSDIVCGTVQIELAGKRKNFSLRYVLTKTKEGLLLEGGRTFTFSDFDLKPPHKIGGLVKVKDKFDVNFALHLSFDFFS